MRQSRRRWPMMIPLSFFVATTFCWSPGIWAAQVVTFKRGQAMVVDSVEKKDGWYYLTLPGGGQLGVPAAQVTRVEEYEGPPVSEPATVTANQVATGTPSGSSASVPPSAALPPVSPAVDHSYEAPAPVPRVNAAGQPPAGVDDWRFKVRRGGGPRPQPGAAGLGGPGFPGRAEGGLRTTGTFPRRPPQQDQPQNQQP